RSTSAPAGNAKRKRGSELQAATIPACAGELVTARMSSGSARLVTCVPAVEMNWPLQSSTKSRLRQSERGRWSDVGVSDISTGDEVIFCLLCEIRAVRATWRGTRGETVGVIARQKLKRRL